MWQKLIPTFFCCLVPLWVVLSPMLFIWMDRRGSINAFLSWVFRHGSRPVKEEEE